MIVTIDGPAGVGKSSVARNLAARLDYDFLDTGAMYRAIAFACEQRGISPGDGMAVAELAGATQIEVSNTKCFVNGTEVSAEIRTPAVTQAASQVAVHPQVREVLVAMQREFAVDKNIVTEGRDQGTIVFPAAECKFFLVAAPEVRAERRRLDLAAKGSRISRDEILREQTERDDRDQSRASSPLKPAEDAILIDTSNLGLEEVADLMERHVQTRRNR